MRTFSIKIHKSLLYLCLCALMASSALHVLAQEANTTDSVNICTVDSLQADTIFTGSSQSWGKRIVQSLEQLKDSPVLNHSQASMMVWDLEQDTLVYQWNAEQLMRPASNAKLLLAVVALDALTADYKLKTKMYYRGTIDSTVLRGDIYIKAGFDPLFDSTDMRHFINAFAAHGIDSIDGRIFVDISMKDTLKWGNGWSWDDDEATLTPLLYNGKDIFMKKFLDGLDSAHIYHPADYQRTIIDPRGLIVMAERGHSLRQLLPLTLKPSQNLYAEAIFYQLGANTNNPYASAEHSAKMVKSFIRDSLCLNEKIYTITDGSGLSHYNNYNAQLLINAIRFAWKHNAVKDCLYNSLPIAGVDGTLSKRMIGTRAQNNVHAKTGSLTHVSTLAGFAKSINGIPLAFAILNAGICNMDEGRNFQDKVCKILTE